MHNSVLQTAALADSAELRVLRVEYDAGSPTAGNLVAAPQDPTEIPLHGPQSLAGSISQLQRQVSREMPQRAGVINAALNSYVHHTHGAAGMRWWLAGGSWVGFRGDSHVVDAATIPCGRGKHAVL